MKIGIVGGAGYAAGELIRLLLEHPEAELAFVSSESQAGKLLSDVHEGITGLSDMRFADCEPLESADIVFMCGGHGRSSEFWKGHAAPGGLSIIDLAQDFRDESDGYVYGLPEVNRQRIVHASKVANPGCFATAIQLSLLPLASEGLLTNDVQLTGITGATGAGVKPSATTHFAWRTDNMSVYKAFTHQHMAEVNRTLSGKSPAPIGHINFVPVRGNFARGIYAIAWTECHLDQQEAMKLYTDFYAGEPFVVVAGKSIDLKQVVNTNRAIIGVEVHDDKLMITTAIDNLLKGAAGQAVQNMNIMNGLDEQCGLRLKASAF